MKFPDLVPECVCTTPITVRLEDGLDEEGCPKKTVLFSGKCNYTQTDYPTTDAQQHKVTITGVALFCGDPVPRRSQSAPFRRSLRLDTAAQLRNQYPGQR